MKLLSWLLVFCLVSIASSQTIRVPLNKITTFDNGLCGFEVWKKAPIVRVKLPSVDTANARFIKFSCVWKQKQGPIIAAMVIPGLKGEELYIDRNYNDDLTDDGPPAFFSRTDAVFEFDLKKVDQPNQLVRWIILRNPAKYYPALDTPDIVDAAGNLSQRIVANIQKFEGVPEFTGAHGTYYITDRAIIRRGAFTLEGKSYAIGLMDGSTNGIYNDDSRFDKLLLDRKGSGFFCVYDTDCMFSTTDTVVLGNRAYRLKGNDPLGKWLELETVNAKRSISYLGVSTGVAADGSAICPIDSSWRQITGKALDGTTIRLGNYSGKYLLLNFWSELCKPCVEEIPILKSMLKAMPQSKFQVVSYVLTENLPHAKKMIADSSLAWPQIRATDDLVKQFNIQGYPTNILILPSGREAVLMRSVGKKFFDELIK